MVMREDYGGLRDRLAEVAESFAERASGEKPALLVSHYDADGLTSASILAYLLSEREIPFHVKIAEQVDARLLDSVASLPYEEVIFTDLGSGEYSLIQRALAGSTRVIIIDHHQPDPGERREGVDEINPHSFGVDGSAEASSSTLAYLFAKYAGGEVPYCAPLAVVGALGDRQDAGPRFTLTGLNKEVLEEAKRRGLMREEVGLRLSALNSRPLVKALEYTFDPYIPGLSGREDMCVSFLKSIGVEPFEDGRPRYARDLSREETRKLATSLVKYMIEKGLPASEAERIFGVNYYLTSEELDSPLRDARGFAQVLNSCGRTGNYAIAIGLCLGYRGRLLKRALEIVREYKRTLAMALQESRKESRRRVVGRVVAVDLRDLIDGRVAGAVASMIAQTSSSPVVLVLGSGSGGLVKVSARAGERSGADLGVALRKVARRCGGVGGGHKKAGGALISPEKLEEFLKALAEEVAS